MSRVTALSAEGIGSSLLAATVIGSGVMAERLAGGNAAIALLANTAATVAVLATLVALLGPLSGAHFNPAVTLVQALRRKLSWRAAGAYAVVQTAGCCVGALLAHAMFDLPWLQLSSHVRSGYSQWLAEGVATFGLLLVVVGHRRTEDAPWMIAAWIGAAYWFTASTSFANPAITIARALSDTFAGIRPVDVPGFVAAQLAGALLAYRVARGLFQPSPGAAAMRTVPNCPAECSVHTSESALEVRSHDITRAVEAPHRTPDGIQSVRHHPEGRSADQRAEASQAR